MSSEGELGLPEAPTSERARLLVVSVALVDSGVAYLGGGGTSRLPVAAGSREEGPGLTVTDEPGRGWQAGSSGEKSSDSVAGKLMGSGLSS